MKYADTQKEELRTWSTDNPAIFRDKSIREVIRYPLIKKQMGLNNLDTSWMEVWDIGCGPLGGVSTVVNSKKVVRVDPLTSGYAKNYPVWGEWLNQKAEDLDNKLSTADLIIVTNALDHFESPDHFMKDLVRFAKPGAFFAHLHAINNAVTHPHEAHEHNVNPEWMWSYLKNDFECVWYEDYLKDGLTYAWLKQPAFSGLYRKVTGYGK